MKRLLGGGLRAHRPARQVLARREAGPHHQPEFTMLEWYRAERAAGRRSPTTARRWCACAALAAGARSRRARPRARRSRARPCASCARATRASSSAATRTPATLRARRRAAAGVALGARPPGTTSSSSSSSTASSRSSAADGPTFVFDWPAPLGALARRKPDDPRVVERFELYAGGLELANAFGELTDAVEQRRRFEEESRIRAARGRQVYPIDEALLAALPRMPPTSGIALGFDRLVMLVLGAADIGDVVAFGERTRRLSPCSCPHSVLPAMRCAAGGRRDSIPQWFAQAAAPVGWRRRWFDRQLAA